MVDVLDLVEEGLSRTALLEVAVVETAEDCILGIGDGGLACVAGHLEVTVCCKTSDPGCKGFRGLLRELLGLAEMDRVDACMEDRHC